MNMDNEEYYVYCPSDTCGYSGIGEVFSPCPECGMPLEPDQVEPE